MFRTMTRILLLAVVLMLASLPAPRSHARSSGPYQSVLANVGVGTAWSANPHCNSFCEFLPPGFTCLHEGVNEKCVTGSGGCTTVACH